MFDPVVDEPVVDPCHIVLDQPNSLHQTIDQRPKCPHQSLQIPDLLPIPNYLFLLSLLNLPQLMVLLFH